MSYEFLRDKESEFQVLINTGTQNYPNVDYGSLATLGTPISYEFNTNISGNSSINNNTDISSPENIKTFWTGDIRSTSTNNSSALSLFNITFNQSEGEVSKGYQDARGSFVDDQTYAIGTNGTLQTKQIHRCYGNTISNYVRVVGILLKDR